MLLRIWWIPQVPMPAFRKEVATLLEAKLLLVTLAQYDIFQLAYNIKPDYCNAGGLEMYDEDDHEWYDWEHPETGEDIEQCSIAVLEHLENS